jgi:hypothetical protein
LGISWSARGIGPSIGGGEPWKRVEQNPPPQQPVAVTTMAIKVAAVQFPSFDIAFIVRPRNDSSSSNVGDSNPKT